MTLTDRCNAIEECYEYMLAYAAQGLSGDEGSGSSSQVRTFLDRTVEALSGLAEAYGATVKHQAFLDVLDRDARDSLAAIERMLERWPLGPHEVYNRSASCHI